MMSINPPNTHPFHLRNPRHLWQFAIQTKNNLTTYSENSKILQILIQTTT